MGPLAPAIRRLAYSPAAARSAAALSVRWSVFMPAGAGMNSAQEPPSSLRSEAYSPAAARSAAALSVLSQENSGSSRPKWP